MLSGVPCSSTGAPHGGSSTRSSTLVGAACSSPGTAHVGSNLCSSMQLGQACSWQSRQCRRVEHARGKPWHTTRNLDSAVQCDQSSSQSSYGVDELIPQDKGMDSTPVYTLGSSEGSYGVDELIQEHTSQSSSAVDVPQEAEENLQKGRPKSKSKVVNSQKTVGSGNQKNKYSNSRRTVGGILGLPPPQTNPDLTSSGRPIQPDSDSGSTELTAALESRPPGHPPSSQTADNQPSTSPSQATANHPQTATDQPQVTEAGTKLSQRRTNHTLARPQLPQQPTSYPSLEANQGTADAASTSHEPSHKTADTAPASPEPRHKTAGSTSTSYDPRHITVCIKLAESVAGLLNEVRCNKRRMNAIHITAAYGRLCQLHLNSTNTYSSRPQYSSTARARRMQRELILGAAFVDRKLRHEQKYPDPLIEDEPSVWKERHGRSQWRGGDEPDEWEAQPGARSWRGGNEPGELEGQPGVRSWRGGDDPGERVGQRETSDQKEGGEHNTADRVEGTQAPFAYAQAPDGGGGRGTDEAYKDGSLSGESSSGHLLIEYGEVEGRETDWHSSEHLAGADVHDVHDGHDVQDVHDENGNRTVRDGQDTHGNKHVQPSSLNVHVAESEEHGEPRVSPVDRMRAADEAKAVEDELWESLGRSGQSTARVDSLDRAPTGEADSSASLDVDSRYFVTESGDEGDGPRTAGPMGAAPHAELMDAGRVNKEADGGSAGVAAVLALLHPLSLTVLPTCGDVRSVSNIMHAFAKMGVRDAEMMTMLLGASTGSLFKMSAQQLSSTVWSLRALQCPPPAINPNFNPKPSCLSGLPVQDDPLAAVFDPVVPGGFAMPSSCHQCPPPAFNPNFNPKTSCHSGLPVQDQPPAAVVHRVVSKGFAMPSSCHRCPLSIPNPPAQQDEPPAAVFHRVVPRGFAMPSSCHQCPPPAINPNFNPKTSCHSGLPVQDEPPATGFNCVVPRGFAMDAIKLMAGGVLPSELVNSRRLQHASPGKHNAFIARTHTMLSTGMAKPQEVSNTLWALGRFGYRPPDSWMLSFEELTCPRQFMGKLSMSELASLMGSMAQLGWMPRLRWQQQFQCGVAHHLKSSGSTHLWPWEMTEIIRVIAVMALSVFSTRDLVSLLHSLAKLGFRPEDSWLMTCLDILWPRLDGADAQELSNLAYSLARLRCLPPPHWIETFLSASLYRLSQFNPQQLANTLWALTAIGVRPNSFWLSSFSDIASKRILMFNASEVRQLRLSIGVLTRDGARHHSLAGLILKLHMVNAKDRISQIL
eukprot:gene9204-16344_t